MSGNLRGICWMLLSTVGFSCSHALVRELSGELHSFQVVFFRGLVGVLVVLPWLYRDGLAFLHTHRLPLHLLRTSLTVTSVSCFYYALSVIPLAKATAIGFMAPILCTALVVLVLKERSHAAHWWAMLLGASGILLIVRPGLIGIDLGTGLMILSTALYACNLLVIKILSRTESSVAITGYAVILLVPVSLPFAGPVWVWPSADQYLVLLVMGLTNGVSLLCFTQSLKEAQTSVVMPLDFLRMIWMTLIGYLWFAEVPDSWTWIGGMLVFGGALLVALSARRDTG